MPRLRSLDVSLEMFSFERAAARSADLFALLCAAPWFSQLQELRLRDLDGLAQLRAAPLLRKLHIDVFLCAPALTAEDGRTLAAAALPELRELQLHTIGPGLVAALAAAPWSSQLEALRMVGEHEGLPRGLASAEGRALAAAQLPSLKQLGLLYVEPGFMAVCATAAWLSRLERVELRGKGGILGGGGGGGGGGGSGLPEGSLAWAAAPFTALTSLTLTYDAIPPPSEASLLAALVAAPAFGRLQALYLHGIPLGTDGSDGAGLRALAAAPLPNLTSLSLSESGLTAADVSGVLLAAPWLAALTSLELTFNHLGAAGTAPSRCCTCRACKRSPCYATAWTARAWLR
jgi:hypothetical protein